MSLALAAGCDQQTASSTVQVDPPPSQVEPAPAADPAGAAGVAPATDQAAAPSAEDGPLVIVMGDSLAAGLGVDPAQAFPALLGDQLAARGLPARVVNAGVSGDTSAGGARRLDWMLKQGPDVLVVELGGNDMLRGQPPAETEANLRQIIQGARAADAEVLLLGMRAMPSLGDAYAAEFDAVYPALAESEGVAFVPFLLDGVAGDPELNQPDGIHPTAAGHERMAALVIDELATLVVAEIAEAESAGSP